MKAYILHWKFYETEMGWTTVSDNGFSVHPTKENALEYKEKEEKKEKEKSRCWEASDVQEIDFFGTKNQNNDLKNGKHVRLLPERDKFEFITALKVDRK